MAAEQREPFLSQVHRLYFEGKSLAAQAKAIMGAVRLSWCRSLTRGQVTHVDPGRPVVPYRATTLKALDKHSFCYDQRKPAKGSTADPLLDAARIPEWVQPAKPNAKNAARHEQYEKERAAANDRFAADTVCVLTVEGKDHDKFYVLAFRSKEVSVDRFAPATAAERASMFELVSVAALSDHVERYPKDHWRRELAGRPYLATQQVLSRRVTGVGGGHLRMLPACDIRTALVAKDFVIVPPKGATAEAAPAAPTTTAAPKRSGGGHKRSNKPKGTFEMMQALTEQRLDEIAVEKDERLRVQLMQLHARGLAQYVVRDITETEGVPEAWSPLSVARQPRLFPSMRDGNVPGLDFSLEKPPSDDSLWQQAVDDMANDADVVATMRVLEQPESVTLTPEETRLLLNAAIIAAAKDDILASVIGDRMPPDWVDDAASSGPAFGAAIRHYGEGLSRVYGAIIKSVRLWRDYKRRNVPSPTLVDVVAALAGQSMAMNPVTRVAGAHSTTTYKDALTGALLTAQNRVVHTIRALAPLTVRANGARTFHFVQFVLADESRLVLPPRVTAEPAAAPNNNKKRKAETPPAAEAPFEKRARVDKLPLPLATAGPRVKDMVRTPPSPLTNGAGLCGPNAPRVPHARGRARARGDHEKDPPRQSRRVDHVRKDQQQEQGRENALCWLWRAAERGAAPYSRREDRGHGRRRRVREDMERGGAPTRHGWGDAPPGPRAAAVLARCRALHAPVGDRRRGAPGGGGPGDARYHGYRHV